MEKKPKHIDNRFYWSYDSKLTSGSVLPRRKICLVQNMPFARWWQLKYVFEFSPRMFGEVGSNFGLRIFCQLGWFKHQLDLICETLRGFETRKYHQNISDSGGLCCFLSFFFVDSPRLVNNQRVSPRRSKSCDVYKPLQKVKLPIVPLLNHFFGNPFSLTLIFVWINQIEKRV